MSTIRTRLRRRSPFPDLRELTIMFQTLELQNLKKLVEGKVRDFPTPEAFQVSIKIQRLGDDTVGASAESGGKFQCQSRRWLPTLL